MLNLQFVIEVKKLSKFNKDYRNCKYVEASRHIPSIIMTVLHTTYVAYITTYCFHGILFNGRLNCTIDED